MRGWGRRSSWATRDPIAERLIRATPFTKVCVIGLFIWLLCVRAKCLGFVWWVRKYVCTCAGNGVDKLSIIILRSFDILQLLESFPRD